MSNFELMMNGYAERSNPMPPAVGYKSAGISRIPFFMAAPIMFFYSLDVVEFTGLCGFSRSSGEMMGWNWLADAHGFYDFDYLHHCFSQGMPSLFPSILTPGQYCKKKVASWQDVIWEQYVRPSHLNSCEGIVSAVGLRGREYSAKPWALAKARCWP